MNVTADELIKETVSRNQSLVKGRHILAIQDTTEINYQAHKGRVSGLGTVGNGTDVGFFLHPMLAVDADDGSCLGFAAIHHWIRTKKKEKNYRAQPIEEKESHRWLTTAESAKATLAAAAQITIIADRESDIYEEWARIPDSRTHLITRAARDRSLEEGGLLFSYMNTLPVHGCYTLALATRPGKRAKHEAKMEVRFSEITLKKPTQCSDKNAPSHVVLTAIDVREMNESVMIGEEAIHWRLLTTHKVSSMEMAQQIIAWYCMRWNIEQLFRTLKRQGLDIESSQVETGEALIKLAIMALGVALHTMQLTLARSGKDQAVSVVFDQHECEVLSALQQTLEGKTEKQKNPHPINKLSWAAWIIARLGGWKGYASESPPGPITMLIGLQQFHATYHGWKLARNLCID